MLKLNIETNDTSPDCKRESAVMAKTFSHERRKPGEPVMYRPYMENTRSIPVRNPGQKPGQANIAKVGK